MTERVVMFDCGQDRLLGILHLVEAPASTAFVFVVGGPQYRVGSHRMFVELARLLADAALPVLRFDCRGMGDSDGTFESFEHLDDDIAAAVDTTLAETGADRVVLLGLCDGASASMIYSGRDDRVAGLVLLNPWVTIKEDESRTQLKYYFLPRLLDGHFWRRLVTGQLDLLDSVRSVLGAVRGAVRRASTSSPRDSGNFVDRMRKSATSRGCPTLILLSEKDLVAQEFAGLLDDDAEWAAFTSRHNVSIAKLSRADHTLSSENCLTDVGYRVVEWVQPLLG